jgi:hypothetical protein
LAGYRDQPQNTIILNATGSQLNGATFSATYIAPIRTVTGAGFKAIAYDTGLKEIIHDPSKTFVINHPIYKNKYLVHACLEGPEGGVYYRGESEIVNNENVTIHLPDYVENLGKEFTVQVTPIYNGKKYQLYTSKINNNQFTVYSDNGNAEFFWVVFGKRCDIEVEPDKDSVNVKGSGPYKWI